MSRVSKRVLKSGLGRVVQERDQVTLHYLAAESDRALSGGKRLESSYDHDTPVVCEIGDGFLLSALERAVVGMQVGSTWRVVVPPEDAFGASGVPGRFPANAPLALEIFIQDAVPAAVTRLSTVFDRLAAPVVPPLLRQDQESVEAPVGQDYAATATILQTARVIIEQQIAGRAHIPASSKSPKALTEWTALQQQHMRESKALDSARESGDVAKLRACAASVAEFLGRVKDRAGHAH